MNKLEQSFGKDAIIMFEGGGNYIVSQSVNYCGLEFCVIIGEASIVLGKGLTNTYMTLEEFRYIEDYINIYGTEQEYREKSFHYQGNYYDLVEINGEYLEKTKLLENFECTFQDQILELYNAFRRATGSSTTYYYK